MPPYSLIVDSLLPFSTYLTFLQSDQSYISFIVIIRYGLLVSLLSDSSLRSLFSTARYLLRGDQRRASASTLLTHAFLMCGLIFIITNTIG